VAERDVERLLAALPHDLVRGVERGIALYL
jgi:hypothetical protein